MGVQNWLVRKGFWYLLCVIAAYSVAWLFDIIPQPIKDLVKWFNDNRVTFSLSFVGCRTKTMFERILTERKKRVTK